MARDTHWWEGTANAVAVGVNLRSGFPEEWDPKKDPHFPVLPPCSSHNSPALWAHLLYNILDLGRMSLSGPSRVLGAWFLQFCSFLLSNNSCPEILNMLSASHIYDSLQVSVGPACVRKGSQVGLVSPWPPPRGLRSETSQSRPVQATFQWAWARPHKPNLAPNGLLSCLFSNEVGWISPQLLRGLHISITTPFTPTNSLELHCPIY